MSQMVLERSHLWVVILSWALALACCCKSCRVPMVMFQLRELKVHVWVPWSMSQGQMKAGSDWCLFLPSGEESSELGPTDDSLDGNDAGAEHEGDLGGGTLGVMMLGVSMMVTLGVFDVCLVRQTSWTRCPYSSLHCQYSSLHCQKDMDLAWLVWWSWKKLSLRLYLPFFHPDGLEMSSRHDMGFKWALFLL